VSTPTHAPEATTDLPSRIPGPSAWYGRDLRATDSWIHRLSAAEVQEIDRAVSDVSRRGLTVAEVGKDDFVLPTLGPVLQEALEELVNGRGFVLFKGLPVQRYSAFESAVAFWGLGAHLGRGVSQNAKGHLLGHVKDLGLDPNNPTSRLYATRARHRYHTDSADIVGLLCLQQAKAGGESSVVSSTTLYNEMMARRPELAAVLAQPFHVDRKGEIPQGKGPHYPMAIFHWYGGHLSTIYARDFIEAAQRFEDVPRLTPEQVEAMDLLDALSADPEIHLDMVLEPGDVQLVHNPQALHARTAFEDHPEPERRRHLLRLWLSPANGRPLPPVFAERYGSVEPGVRGGIRVEGVEPYAPLSAEG